eukprot:CAMPEP_0119281184 /NCGR_PEP_ID=MMETSP1329-20130426/24228_1 /TAXON_ID=114041 /ORGANISM="Genus nov. species nov., Strain RCC1024" /LENGTH=149 /DNA_ID=CAMNT_0007281791 /DNA_START=62 /DNA_END=508 /DNA_ORIENTATION=+
MTTLGQCRVRFELGEERVATRGPSGADRQPPEGGADAGGRAVLKARRESSLEGRWEVAGSSGRRRFEARARIRRVGGRRTRPRRALEPEAPRAWGGGLGGREGSGSRGRRGVVGGRGRRLGRLVGHAAAAVAGLVALVAGVRAGVVAVG